MNFFDNHHGLFECTILSPQGTPFGEKSSPLPFHLGKIKTHNNDFLCFVISQDKVVPNDKAKIIPLSFFGTGKNYNGEVIQEFFIVSLAEGQGIELSMLDEKIQKIKKFLEDKYTIQSSGNALATMELLRDSIAHLN